MRTKDEFNEQKQRQQLLNSAWKLFYQKGYQNTTMEDILKEAEMTPEEIKYFVLHQANYRILEAASRRLKIPMEKIPVNIDRYGNTSAASIPILLDEMKQEGKLKRGDKLVLAGFGSGMTWGATLLEW